jgi:CBS-domain-containing membrane protein
MAVPPNLSVEDFVFEQVMRHGHRALPVVDNGRLMGIVSLSDARKLPLKPARLDESEDRCFGTRITRYDAGTARRPEPLDKPSATAWSSVKA